MQNISDTSSENNKIAGKVYLMIFSISLFWLALIIAGPFLETEGGIYKPISDYINVFFSRVCHQEDARSFHIYGHKLGVCSRCAWLYSGFFSGTVIYPLRNRISNFDTPSVFYLLAFSLLLFLDVILDSAGIMKNTFLTRSLTGFLTGLVLPFYIIPGFVNFFCEVHSYFRSKFIYKN